MEYCCNVWARAPSCNLELLEKLQKRIYRTVGPSLAASLEPFAHCWNVASLSLFYRYYFGRCSSGLAQLVPVPFSWGRFTHYFNRLHGFSVTVHRYCKDVYVRGFFRHTARLCNSLHIECFPLTLSLELSFNCRFFLSRFPVCISVILFPVTPCLIVVVQPCMEWRKKKKKEEEHIHLLQRELL